MELNKVTYQSYQNKALYTISTSLIQNKIKLVCVDDNSAVYENVYSVEELTKISQYFLPTHTIDQIQEYLNSIIKKEKITITQRNETLFLNLYLINKDYISIPLLKKDRYIGMNNYSNKKEEGQNYNNYHNYDNSEIQISELKRKLKEEKDKNQKLINDNNNLKEKINNLNIELNQIKVLNVKLSNDLTQKNIEIQKLLSPPKKSKEYYDMSSIRPNDRMITINFVSMGRNDIGHYSLICKKRDLFVKLEERLYEDFPQFKDYQTYFEVNGKRIKRFKTLEQNQIKNNDIISMFIIDE